MNTGTASGYYYKNESSTCPGVQPYGMCTASRTCSPNLLTLLSPAAPCCNSCDQISAIKSKSWFWECVVPQTGTYTFRLLVGQTTYIGTCLVTATTNSVSIGNCNLFSGWFATDVSFYMSDRQSTSCSPGTFGKPPGLLRTFAAPVSGDLTSVGVSLTRNIASIPRYIMVHFKVGQ